MFFRALFVVLALLLPTTLWAHDAHPPHGGMAEDAGPYFIELVFKGDQIKAYLFDDATEKPASVKGAKATVTILHGQKKETVQLTIDGSEKAGNLFAGKSPVASAKGMKVVVQLQMPGKGPLLARFSM